ncbi:MCF2 protein, partial [Sterrhoptilus dennistouni]|nr:MCF2 protein [Sterrhoptilus dennistouni]
QHESDTKFILILDRRLDTWTSVKTTLQKIAASFPGNLHLVMVLHPTGFFQRTFTDIGFRFSQEDFLLKLPVVMLSSVSDLLTYIDEQQLTPELGGTLEYCHSEWVIFRTAIESFALTVKEIAQMLQCFGTELAETELPEDMYSIERILALRTERYCQLKITLPATSKRSELPAPSCLQQSLSGACSSSVLCTSGSQEGRGRLYQLHGHVPSWDPLCLTPLAAKSCTQSSSADLEGWFVPRSLCLVKNAIEFLMGQQVELPNTGDSYPQVKQRLKDLDHFDGMAQDLIGKAQVVILHGHQLAANHHYALNLICQQCNELRHHSDLLSEEIKRKQMHLQKTLELHTRLQQALHCCDEGAYLLANQQMDKCQSKEGAQKALQDIERFLESSSAYLNYDPQALHYNFESVLTSELKCQIQSVQVKLENIHSMLVNRQSCFRKLLDKHMRLIQLVAPRPENPPRSKSSLFSPKHGKMFSSQCIPFLLQIEVMHDYQEKRNSLQYFIPDSDDSLDILKGHVINELIETERVYVEELFTVLMGYRAEMDNPAMLILLPPVLRNRKDVLFGNMPEIYDFHNKIFLHSLENCLGAPERVGCCFLDRREDFQMYEKYCQNKPRSESLWRQCSESSFFQECQRKLEHKLGLDSYLLKPVQRLTKYQLLLKELLKYSTSCDGVQELQEALVAMLDLLKSVNDSMHQISITGYDVSRSE